MNIMSHYQDFRREISRYNNEQICCSKFKRTIQKLLETLANQLNSLGYGALTVGEYKRVS